MHKKKSPVGDCIVSLRTIAKFCTCMSFSIITSSFFTQYHKNIEQNWARGLDMRIRMMCSVWKK